MSEEKLELSLDVRGSNGIDFEEGWQTGNMEEGGVQINTVWYADDRARFGVCIDRDQARQLHRFLGRCIQKWENESTEETLTTEPQ